MQWSQATERQPRSVEVEFREHQLGSDDDANEHADDAPDNSHDGELPHNLVVIGHGHGVCGHSGEIPRVLNAGIFSGRDLSLNK